MRNLVKPVKTIGLLTLDTLFWSKKTLFIAAVSLVIVGLAVLGRLILSFSWIRVPFTPEQVFGTLMATAVIHFLVTFVTLFYGTALISEELEGRTITYLFTRPVPKPAIMIGKYLALVWISSMLVIPTILVSYLVLYLGPDTTRLMRDVGTLGKDVGIVFLAMLVYGAFFSLLGAWLKHPILVGLIYAFGWEGIISYLPGFTRKLTVTHYVQSISPHADTASAIAMMIGERTPALESVITLVLMAAFFLASASLILREKEYVLEQ
ncbi:MAG: ABC transporter permease [Acidobacteria bacterium]|nr:ABC transporter permease [Acidobacteriota bacterium]